MPSETLDTVKRKSKHSTEIVYLLKDFFYQLSPIIQHTLKLLSQTLCRTQCYTHRLSLWDPCTLYAGVADLQLSWRHQTLHHFMRNEAVVFMSHNLWRSNLCFISMMYDGVISNVLIILAAQKITYDQYRIFAVCALGTQIMFLSSSWVTAYLYCLHYKRQC